MIDRGLRVLEWWFKYDEEQEKLLQADSRIVSHSHTDTPNSMESPSRYPYQEDVLSNSFHARDVDTTTRHELVIRLCQRRISSVGGRQEQEEKMRRFEGGAIRDSEEGKHDYEGYLSPLVIERFGAYMAKHQIQGDGVLRRSDNWQKGIPIAVYIKSAFRHFLEWWRCHRGWQDTGLEDALCALLFNVSGYLHVVLEEKYQQEQKDDQSARRELLDSLPDPTPSPRQDRESGQTSTPPSDHKKSSELSVECLACGHASKISSSILSEEVDPVAPQSKEVVSGPAPSGKIEYLGL